MAKKRATTGTTAAALAAVGMVVLASPTVAAQSAPTRTVVLHVTDYEKMPTRELTDAQQYVSRTFAHIGVSLVWTCGSAKLVPADGALHLDILVLTADMVDRVNPKGHAAGEARHAAGRVYLYYSRILGHSMRMQGDPALALGFALAHELGHMLLPNHRHTEYGLMAATWAGRIVQIPDFTSAQAAAVRATLTAATK